MIALGNDVIDLDWHPKNGNKYFNRLASYAFTLSEHNELSEYISTTAGKMLLWSIKEASYKSATKLGCSSRFIPKNFNIKELEVKRGFFYSTISYKSNCLKGKSVVKNNKVHSITVHESSNLDSISFNDHLISSDKYSEQSKTVRHLLKNDLFNDSITISKNERGVPYLILGGDASSMEISFSHHGKVVGYAISL